MRTKAKDILDHFNVKIKLKCIYENCKKAYGS